MKPIKLSMTAFGPFANEEIIDFQEISKEPVFLICGPTGAGKTTVFDAISYALFGEASGGERKPDSMRSDFAGDDVLTQVEFIFEVKGKTYQIMRQPRQIRPKKSGEGFTEVPAKAELIFKDEQGKPMVFTRNVEIDENIKEIIGLGSDQFKQIMMLPQGQFRKLLTADSKEREGILREIFDAQRYLNFQLKLKSQSDQLEKEIRDIKRSQKEWISQIKSSEGFLAELLSQEEVDFIELFQGINQQNQVDLKLAETMQAKSEEINLQINQQKEKYFKQQQENQKLQELQDIQAQIILLKEQSESIKDKEKLVQQIQGAIELKPYAEQCEKLGLQQQQLNKEVNEYKAKLKDVNQQMVHVEKEYQLIKSVEHKKMLEDLENHIQVLNVQLPLIKKLIVLRIEFSQLKKQEQEFREALENKYHQREQLQQEMILNKKIIEDTEHIEEQKLQLEKEKNELLKINEVYQKYQSELDKNDELRQTEIELTQKEQQAEQDYQVQVKKLHRNHVIAIQNDLKDGDLCPVCQGIYHVQMEKAEKLCEDINIEIAEQTRNKWRQERERFEQKKIAVFTRQKALMEQLLEETQRGNLIEVETYLKEEEGLSSKKHLIYEDLLEKSELRKKARNEISRQEKAMEDINQQIDKIQEQHNQKKSNLDVISGEGKHLKESILPEYQNQINDNLVQELQKKLENIKIEKQDCLNRMEKIEQQHQESLTNQVEIRSHLQNIEQQFKSITKQLQEETDGFIEKQIKAGFSNYQLWQETIAQADKKQIFIMEIKQYQEDFAKYSSVENQLLKEVKIEHPHNINMIQETIESLEQSKNQLNIESIEKMTRIKENTRVLERLEAMEKERAKQVEEYDLVSELASVSNGNNSKKLTFERYVLAAFLEDVLKIANIRLEKMTGRYSLKRKDEVTHKGRQSGLEIEVFDAFTGKTRSINTLSGGEGFKSALAMALGLSEVVSNYAGGIELDMLFIDEGFGTLDPESLDAAIDCIMDLQAKGKIIGIISHVSELKERIPAKLEVIQTPQGSYTHYRVGHR